MKISIDTKEDSSEDIKRAIRMLQNIVGDSQEIFTNLPVSELSGDETAASVPKTSANEALNPSENEKASESTEDLFSELFSDEEIKKMDKVKVNDEDEHEEEQVPKTKEKKYDIGIY